MSMTNKMDRREFWQYFRGFVSNFQSKKDAAVFLNISEAYLDDMYHGRRKISHVVADRLGFSKVEEYRAKEPPR